jgi:hypothetical protein
MGARGAAVCAEGCSGSVAGDFAVHICCVIRSGKERSD